MKGDRMIDPIDSGKEVNSMADEILRPCPFCGSKAHIEKGMVRFWHNKSRKCRKRYAYMIGCSDPDCILYNNKRYGRLFFTVSEHGVETMIRRWNRRDGEYHG